MFVGLEPETITFTDILSRNPLIQTAKTLAMQAIASNQHLLIIGEPGTEKESFAAAVHNAGPSGCKFTGLDCRDASGSLMERMLFGSPIDISPEPFMKGCNQGTLYLEEIAEMPIAAQARIARAIQAGNLAFDSGEALPFSCRIVASTSSDLVPYVEDHTFRADLYNVLAKTTIYLPPLRHRRDDIALLVNAFIKSAATKLHKSLNSISDQAMHALSNYTWPGNVSELKSVIERAAVLAKGEMILLDHLPKSIQQTGKNKGTGPIDDEVLSLAVVEKRHIQRVLDYTGWHKVRTAQILGIDRSTLYDKIKRYNLANPADRVLEMANI